MSGLAVRWVFALGCAVVLAAALGPVALARAGERCGPNLCADGTTCCNDSCGICAGPGEACIQPDCGWGPDRVAGRRPILALDHPGALLGPRLGVQGGLGAAANLSGGQLIAAGAMPLGTQLRLRASLDLVLASYREASPAAGSSFVGRDGAARSELGVGYNLPLGSTWLQTALLVDAVAVHRRWFAPGPAREWRLGAVELAPGVAFVAQRWSVALAGFVRAARQLSCAGLDCADSPTRLWDAGLSLDADGRNLGVPIGILLHGRAAEGGNTAGVVLWWLLKTVRLGAEVRSQLASPLDLGWPATEWNLRIDWLGAER